MNTLKCNEKDKLHFVWFMILIVCVIITYYYQKSKAIDSYKTILQIASKNCNLEVVKFSVKNLLDINTQIPILTALHHAAEGGCLEIVKFLIDEGININVASKQGNTSLHNAAYRGNLEIIKLLLENGANPNIINKDGKRPRHVAVIELRHNTDKPYDEIINLLYNAEKQHESNQYN